MAVVPTAGMLYPWLPRPVRSLHDWLKRHEPTWGFTIYRTIYTPESEAAFAEVVDTITAYIKSEFYKTYEGLRQNRRTADKANIAVFDELWAAYKPRVLDDATQFDGLSIDQLRIHFEAWANELGKADKFPSYRMFIVIDEECFNSIQNAPVPEELPLGMKFRVAHYVKLVEAWQDQDRDSRFPGWMKCSLPGLWDLWRNMGNGDYMRKTWVMACDRDVY